MENEWLTYIQAAERMNTTRDIIRQRAQRGRWPRQIGNDGLARIHPPEGWTNYAQTLNEQRDRRPGTVEQVVEQVVRATVEQVVHPCLIKALQEHVESLKEQIAAAVMRDAQHAEALAAEKARAQKAIDDYTALAGRLMALAEELAAERSRSWWRRMLGRTA